MSSPAERYAAARRQQQPPQLRHFAAGYPFELDAFQDQACRALDAGRSVLVAAPTGAGKTVVADFAVHLALHRGGKCFYTTPIKALSNQKYGELVARLGEQSVGLLTGDNTVNGEAPVVVMTTEVLRNMLYADSSTLAGLSHVVLDEVHYLADRFRGSVWEEVILTLSTEVCLVALSATVSNAEEFGAWLGTVRGDTDVVVEEHRPVPLWQSVLVGGQLYDLFADAGEVNPALLRAVRERTRLERWTDRRPQRGGRRQLRYRYPGRPEVLDRLDADGRLPAIVFVFSRAGCDAAVAQCARAGIRLASAEARRRIREHVAARTSALSDADLAVLGYWEWREALERGLAAHHAGLLPTFKEVVEELFVRGLLKVVFATETLSLGVNMPARSVVLERLTKWNGEAHLPITPGEYTQLTGRAGRRGIDLEGHGIVIWTPEVDPRQLAGLASTRTYPLRSSFRPTYNMAVNLVGAMGTPAARELLESSFAQFQADRSVVGLARQLTRLERQLAEAEEAAGCQRGDFTGYYQLRRSLAGREAAVARAAARGQRGQAADTLAALCPGDVIRVPRGRRAGLSVVLERAGESGRPTVLTAARQVRRLAASELAGPVSPVGRVRLPRGFNPRSAQARRDLAASVRNLSVAATDPGPTDRTAAPDAESSRLRAAIRGHPCHRCPRRQEHLSWAERADRLRREAGSLSRRMRARTDTLGRTFDRVCAVLEELGYLSDGRVTAPGRTLARVYAEGDLLVTECLQRGTWLGLSPAELAAVVAVVAVDARGPAELPPRLPPGRVPEALAATTRTWARLAEVENRHGLANLPEPDLSFSWPAYRWARGGGLAEVVGEQLSAGDFVRGAKQLADLLEQLVDTGDGGALSGTARAAVHAVRRGVVAYSSVG